MAPAGLTYVIGVRGEMGPLLGASFPEAVINASHGSTELIALVRDESELLGLLARLHDFRLHVVSLREVDGPPSPSPV